MTHEWQLFTDDFDYDKRPYIVRTPDGVECVCWPNGGIMNSMDGSGRRWNGAAGVECKFAYPDDDAMGTAARRIPERLKRAAGNLGIRTRKGRDLRAANRCPVCRVAQDHKMDCPMRKPRGAR